MLHCLNKHIYELVMIENKVNLYFISQYQNCFQATKDLVDLVDFVEEAKRNRVKDLNDKMIK